MPETANSVEQNQSQPTTKLDELDTVKLNFLINRLIEKDKEEQKKAEELQQKQQEEEAAAATEESTQESKEQKELQDSVDRENAQHAELVTELKKTNETLADSGSNTQEDLLAEIKVTNEKLQTVIENQSSATVYQENSYSLGTLAFAGFIACVGAYVSFKACSVIVSFVKQAFR